MSRKVEINKEGRLDKRDEPDEEEEIDTKERRINQLLRKHGFTAVRRQGREGHERCINGLYNVLLDVLMDYL